MILVAVDGKITFFDVMSQQFTHDPSIVFFDAKGFI